MPFRPAKTRDTVFPALAGPRPMAVARLSNVSAAGGTPLKSGGLAPHRNLILLLNFSLALSGKQFSLLRCRFGGQARLSNVSAAGGLNHPPPLAGPRLRAVVLHPTKKSILFSNPLLNIFLSYPRKRVSSIRRTKLDSRFRGNDKKII